MTATTKAACEAFICLVLFISSEAKPSIYTYVWSPRTEDIGITGTKDYLVLRSLLALTKPKQYTVISGDNLDFIIRKTYLVSQKYRNAYSLYLNRILELNPGLNSRSILRIGITIAVPAGPIYGGTEIGNEALSQDAEQVMFAKLSKRAYELGVTTNDKIQRFATRSLGAYLSPSTQSSPPTPDKQALVFETIKTRGLVNAINLNRHPEARLNQMQVLDLNVTDEAGQAALATITTSDPTNLLPGMFPVSDPAAVVCDKSKPCIDCATNLKIPPTVDLSKARLLIEDTGIASGQIDLTHLIPERSGDNGLDESPVNHGTFVYSEIAAPAAPGEPGEFGVIPKSNVYVAKAVEDAGGIQYFSMSDIMNGWKIFSAMMNKDLTAASTKFATTWIVNVSAFGEPVPDPDHPPAIPNDGHLLIVAAAGNHEPDGTEDQPALFAFPRLSNGSTPLIIAGALGVDGKPAKYSNWNSTYVHLFAPGDCVCGAPGQISGTSQATPFVSTAAAVLASANPDWNPRYVMWRLISTADHATSLQGKALAGTVNLERALDPSIIVEEKVAGAPSKIHHAKSISYDSAWKAAFTATGINVLNKETLRLYSPAQGIDANQTCFTALQILYPPINDFCVRSDSKVELVENGSPVDLQAEDISDIILPMPGNSTVPLPDISLDMSH
jgi:hypothetical protein